MRPYARIASFEVKLIWKLRTRSPVAGKVGTVWNRRCVVDVFAWERRLWCNDGC